MMETKPEVEMSDIANETQEPVTVTVADLVNSIEKGDAFTSSKMFTDLLQDRIDDALEQEKIRIANSVYNNAEEEEEISDEEVEAAVDELESEVEEEPTPEEPVAELPDEDEHEEPEDTLGLYADEVEEILNSEESEDESEEENV